MEELINLVLAVGGVLVFGLAIWLVFRQRPKAPKGPSQGGGGLPDDPKGPINEA